MPLNKPTLGQTNWGPVLNASLDYLDGRITVIEADSPLMISGPSNARTGTGEVLRFNDVSSQSIIIGPNPTTSVPTAPRLVVAGADGRAGTTGEGGDVYLWAGRGGSSGGSGGDVKVDAGNGGGTTGSGGTVKVRGGYSQESNGGFVQIYAGDSSEGSGGYLELRAGSNSTDTESYGGAVDIEAGGSGNAMGGGNINLRTYQAGKILLSGDGGEFLNDSSDPDNQIATIGDIASGSTGDITFDGVQIIGAGTAASDASGNGTIELIPDADLNTDQYLVIEPTGGPTGPGHIHIRAGGDVDASTADLYIGGERNFFVVSDSERAAAVNVRPSAVVEVYLNTNSESSTSFTTADSANLYTGFVVNVGGTDYVVDSVSSTGGVMTVTATGAVFTAGETYTFTYEPTWNNQWVFTDTGYLYGPAMGGLQVSGLLNGESDLWLASNDNVVLSSNNGGEFIGDSSNAGNQIAKIAYSREHYTTPETITGAIADIGKLLYANCGDGDMTYLIPDNGDVAFPIGSEIKFATGGDARWFINRENVEGATDLIADGGNGYTAINDAYPYIIPIYSTGSLMKVDTNRWILSGMRLTD